MGNDKDGTKLTVPLEMVITKKEREGIPTEEAIAKQKSLKEKLQEHYAQKKKRRSDVLKNVLTPDFVNSFAVPTYLFTVASAWKIAFFDVMPVMYEGNDTVIFWQRVLSVVLLFEIMVNWLGIRYVDSSYTRLLRIKTRQEEDDKDGSSYENVQDKQKSLHDKEDSSCAKLIETNTGTDNNKKVSKGNATRSGDKSEPSNEDPKLRLIAEAQKANSEMELRNLQRKSISDLIKSSEEEVSSKAVQQQSSNSKSSKTTKGSKAASTDKINKPVVAAPVISKKTNTVTYPYWSWVPCFDCNRIRPPRCHHCPVCKTCTLKRDHHCFFAGNCVGYRNHRFFYTFLLWAWFCSVYSTIHGFPYIYTFLWQDMSYFDVLVPIVLLRWILGYVSFQAALCITTLSCCIYFDMLTTTFIYTHSQLIRWGLTSFEKVYLKRSLEIKDSRKLSHKIRAVFGRNWLLNLIVPMSWLYDVEEDPIEWPHIEVIKHK